MMSESRARSHRGQDPCASLSATELEELAGAKWPTRTLGTREPLFLEGDEGEGVFIIRRGWAVTYVMLDDGRRQILRFALPGTLLGFQSAPDGTMPCTAEALTDLSVCTIPRRKLLTLCQRIPQLAIRLATILAAETTADWQRLGGLGRCNATERIARLLLELYQRLRSGLGDGDVELPLNQTLIADATGLTPVHVCRTLKEMRADGLLAFDRGRLHLGDPAKLAAIAQLGDRREDCITGGSRSPERATGNRTSVPVA